MKDGRRFGRPSDPLQPRAIPAGKINLTDPNSRNVKTSRGSVHGRTAQAAVTAEQIVIAAEVTVDSRDFGHLEPMVDTTERELTAIGFIVRMPEATVQSATKHGPVRKTSCARRSPSLSGTVGSARRVHGGARCRFVVEIALKRTLATRAR